MPPSTGPAYLYLTESDLAALLSADGTTGRLDDDANAAVSPAEQAYLTQAIAWASSRVDFFLSGRYAQADLAQSWLVNQWAVVCAAYWLSTRRGNPPPGSCADLYKEAVQDMRSVKAGEYQLPDVGLREAGFPAWSNGRVEIGYALRKWRIERPLSDRTPTTYPQQRDIPSDFIVEPN